MSRCPSVQPEPLSTHALSDDPLPSVQPEPLSTQPEPDEPLPSVQPGTVHNPTGAIIDPSGAVVIPSGAIIDPAGAVVIPAVLIDPAGIVNPADVLRKGEGIYGLAAQSAGALSAGAVLLPKRQLALQLGRGQVIIEGGKSGGGRNLPGGTARSTRCPLRSRPPIRPAGERAAAPRRQSPHS